MGNEASEIGHQSEKVYLESQMRQCFKDGVRDQLWLAAGGSEKVELTTGHWLWSLAL